MKVSHVEAVRFGFYMDTRLAEVLWDCFKTKLDSRERRSKTLRRARRAYFHPTKKYQVGLNANKYLRRFAAAIQEILEEDDTTGYYGGKVEKFIATSEKVYYYDMNSAHPIAPPILK